MEIKRCSTCGKKYSGLEVYCTKCGVRLVKDENRCSQMKTELCRHKNFDDDDIYCCYCGSLTTYAAEKQNK